MRDVDGRTLPWRIANRVVKPYALAVSFSTFVVSFSILNHVAVGQLLKGPLGHMIGAAGFADVLLLLAGWWFQREDWMAKGLFITIGVWASVWAIVMYDTALTNVSGWLAFAWSLASGGAWLLEVLDAERR